MGQHLPKAKTAKLLKVIIIFPPDSINQEYLKPTETHTTCGWKGVASYYTVAVNGEENKDAAWYYPQPKEKAENIKNYVAFWRGVKVES